MIVGVFLAMAWLILLWRYPRKALPISLAAAVGLGIVASWVLWQDSVEQRQLALLELRLQLEPQQCPADRPLRASLRNGSRSALQSLEWQVRAYQPGHNVNLARDLYETPRYQAPGHLLPGSLWETCLPLPELRPGYRASALEFRAEALKGHFIQR